MTTLSFAIRFWSKVCSASVIMVRDQLIPACLDQGTAAACYLQVLSAFEHSWSCIVPQAPGHAGGHVSALPEA